MEVFQLFEPQSEVLSKYISCYYIHEEDDSDAHKCFVYYPHFNSAITVYEHSKILFDGTNSFSVKDYSQRYFVCYTTAAQTSKMAHMEAPFKKLGIVFRPLGLSYFFDQSLIEVIEKFENREFNFFGDSFLTVVDTIFSTNDNAEKASLLDSFFMRRFYEWDLEVLHKAIDFILNAEHKVTVSVLCSYLCMTQKTLYRLFKKHLGCSIKAFIDIAKFRQALHLYMDTGTNHKMIDLSYALDYYDQAEFNKHFKKLTGRSPSKILSEISNVGAKDIFWKLE